MTTVVISKYYLNQWILYNDKQKKILANHYDIIISMDEDDIMKSI